MYIYKITNIKNGKIYIGQTIRSIKERFDRHISDALSNTLDTHLARAIRKYGKENFVIECIDTAKTQTELTEKEYYWIEKLNSTNSKVGYNETNSKRKCGGNTYARKSRYELEKISQKISASKTGKQNPNSRKIKCLNVYDGTELFFDTLSDCKAYFNEKNHRFVSTRVAHHTRGLYKGKWAIAYAEQEYFYEKEVFKKGTLVCAESQNFKRTYNSIRAAARDLGLSRYKINELFKKSSVIYIGEYKISIIN